MDMAHFVWFDPMFFLPTIYPMVTKCWIGYPWICPPTKDAIGKWRIPKPNEKRPLHFFGCKLSRQDPRLSRQGVEVFPQLRRWCTLWSSNDGKLWDVDLPFGHDFGTKTRREIWEIANFHTWAIEPRTWSLVTVQVRNYGHVGMIVKMPKIIPRTPRFVTRRLRSAAPFVEWIF